MEYNRCISDIKDGLNKINLSKYHKQEKIKEFKSEKENLLLKYKKANDYLADNLKAYEILNNVSTISRNKAKTLIETLVTNTLRYVFENNCEFIIKLGSLRGQPSASFFIKEIINGEESLQDIKDSNGGGYCDVVSTILRIAFINIISDPKINGAIILDEPGKMISEKYRTNFSTLLKNLAHQFDTQIINCTHNEEIKQISDNINTVTLVDTVSKINYVEDDKKEKEDDKDGNNKFKD